MGGGGGGGCSDEWVSLPQAELNSLNAQLEELDRKCSSAEKSSKNQREEAEELQERLADETRAKLAANNKQKQLAVSAARLLMRQCCMAQRCTHPSIPLPRMRWSDSISSWRMRRKPKQRCRTSSCR